MNGAGGSRHLPPTPTATQLYILYIITIRIAVYLVTDEFVRETILDFRCV